VEECRTEDRVKGVMGESSELSTVSAGALVIEERAGRTDNHSVSSHPVGNCRPEAVERYSVESAVSKRVV
jgi:hypothetical protein